MIASQYQGCRLAATPSGRSIDGYHGYLVTGWLARLSGRAAFTEALPIGPVAVEMPVKPEGALRAMSEAPFDLGPGRRRDWTGMRAKVMCRLDADAGMLVDHAAALQGDEFAGFFEIFVRATCGDDGLVMPQGQPPAGVYLAK